VTTSPRLPGDGPACPCLSLLDDVVATMTGGGGGDRTSGFSLPAAEPLLPPVLARHPGGGASDDEGLDGGFGSAARLPAHVRERVGVWVCRQRVNECDNQ
jgi:hypothetical protein